MLLAARKVLQSRASSVFLGCTTEMKSTILGHAIKNGLLTVSPIDMVFRERSPWGFSWLLGHSSAFRPKSQAKGIHSLAMIPRTRWKQEIEQ